jgi:predicted nuclease of predicted toxin-antitoxin system
LSGPTSEPPEFYVDVGLGGIAVPNLVRTMGCTALTKLEVFGRRTVEDTEWIAWADARGLVVLTKDDAIRRRPLERAALANSTLRVFCLTNANLTKAEQVSRFERLWPAILRRCEEPGPFVCGVYADRLQELRV